MYVLSHMYVFPNVERISNAKSLRLGTLSLLTSIQKLFTDRLFKTTNAEAPKKHRGYSVGCPTGWLGEGRAF